MSKTPVRDAIRANRDRALRPIAGYLPANERTSNFARTRPVLLAEGNGCEMLTTYARTLLPVENSIWRRSPLVSETLV